MLESFLAMVVVAVIVLSGCAEPREGFVRRKTTGAPYNKSKGAMRERTPVPAPWK